MEHSRHQDLRHLVDQTRAGPAREDHGRAVTTNRRAAAWYREAQRAVDRQRVIVALSHAVAADPEFELALVDLGAIVGTPAVIPCRGQMNWERHHIEVVCLAATGKVGRASDLLREHLAGVGCDPLAYRITAQFRRTLLPDALDDIADQLPGCHPPTVGGEARH